MNKFRRLVIYVLLTTAAVFFCWIATSCDSDWWGPAPSGWNSPYDNTLSGSWVLVASNGQNVAPGNANYLTFNGNGTGVYYYYSGGRLYSEAITYFCQYVPSGKIVNIRYASGQASTMNYWFTDKNNLLWMQWTTTSGQSLVYTYSYTRNVP